MKAVKVEYTVRPDFVETNKANVKKVMDKLQAMENTGLHYSTHIKEDGKSFVHLAIMRDEAAGQVLPNLEEFSQFRAALKTGVEVPPAAEELAIVGTSFQL